VKRLLAIPFAVFALLLVTRPGAAHAQTGGNDPLPPYVGVGGDGRLHFDPSGLTPGEPIVMPPPEGFPALEGTIPGTDLSACLGCLVFNTYTSADGATVIIPNAYTAIVMAVTGESPFNTTPDFWMGNGILQIAAMAGAFEGMGIPPEELTLENIAARLDPRSSEYSPFFLLQLNWALNNPDSPLNTGTFFWAAGIFEFSCHPVTGQCAPVPTDNPNDGDGNGTSDGDKDWREVVCEQLGDCTEPPTDDCPRNWEIIVTPPTYTAQVLDPPYPVVVGQDPQKRGVDLLAGVTVPPVIVKFNVEKEVPGERECTWFETTGHGGCAGYDGEWYRDGHWGWHQEKIKVCERQTRTYPDAVTNLSITMELDPESIAWIESGELQARYPGAKVYQATWRLWRGLYPSKANIAPDRTTFLLEWDRLQLRDPGYCRVLINGKTSGTPYTAPRSLDYNQRAFSVAVVMTALTK